MESVPLGFSLPTAQHYDVVGNGGVMTSRIRNNIDWVKRDHGNMGVSMFVAVRLRQNFGEWPSDAPTLYGNWRFDKKVNNMVLMSRLELSVKLYMGSSLGTVMVNTAWMPEELILASVQSLVDTVLGPLLNVWVHVEPSMMEYSSLRVTRHMPMMLDLETVQSRFESEVAQPLNMEIIHNAGSKTVGATFKTKCFTTVCVNSGGSFSVLTSRRTEEWALAVADKVADFLAHAFGAAPVGERAAARAVPPAKPPVVERARYPKRPRTDEEKEAKKTRKAVKARLDETPALMMPVFHPWMQRWLRQWVSTPVPDDATLFPMCTSNGPVVMALPK